MKTKLFTLLLALVASIGTIFAESGTCGNNLTWDLTNGVLTISGSGDMTIWSSSSDVPWYSYREKITSVTIGNSVTSIGKYAFRDCSHLTSVTIGNSVTSIGDYAFRGCSGLTSIEIPNSVTDIGNYAFFSCTSLTSIEIPNSVTRIWGDAFSNCTSLISITIPNSVISIGMEVFANCSALTSIEVEVGNSIYDSRDNCNAIIETSTNTLILGCKNTIIPNSVTSIGDFAFYGCTGLTSITIPNSVTSIEQWAFASCTGLTSITIPNNVTSIGLCAFIDCTGLMSITIPNSVTSIEDFAFDYVPNIFYSGTATGSPWGARSRNGFVDGLLVYADNSQTSLLACSSKSQGEIIIPNSVTSIGSYAFINCIGLTSIAIPNSVTSIGDGAFSGCTGLTSITIPNSVTRIGSGAFDGCNNIKSVIWNARNCTAGNFGSQIESFTFGDEVEVIPASLCAGMNLLSSIVIPNSVTSIGDGAFSGCNNLKHVILNSNAIVSKAYSTSSNLVTIFGSQVEEYVLGEEISAIGSYAMYNASSLQTITIPSNILSIGQSAFNGCSQLMQVIINSNPILSKTYSPSYNIATIFGSQVESYSIGESVSSIGDYAFYGCTNLSTITIPVNVTQIGSGAFQGCTGIGTLEIPHATSIGNSVFADCSNLTTVQLGNGLSSLGDSAFSSCYNLPAITLPSTLTSVGDYAFYQCNRISTINIPSSITYLGEGAFKGCTRLTTVSINSNAVMSKAYNKTSNLSTIFGTQVQSYILSDAVTAIGVNAFYGCAGISAITIPDNVTQIGSGAFNGCIGLRSIIIPNNITSIEESTFSGCTALGSIKMPPTVTSIKDKAFYNCNSLALDTLPASITNIGREAFAGCNSLAVVNIPPSLTTIGENAFADCISIAKVGISDLAAWCKISFANSQANPLFYARNLYYNNELLTDLVIPNGVTVLKDWTFNNCSSIKSVYIPNTVKNLASTSFTGCSNITSVEWHGKAINDYASAASAPFYSSRSKISSFVFGEEVEHIPAYLCNGMSKINSLAFPSYLKTIGDYSFKDLTKIKQINIPNEVETIGAHAFDSCIFVTSIYLGYNVEEIGDYAFKGCIRVNDITSMNTTTPVVYENTLSSISNYAYLFVPAGSKRTYQLDPYWGRFDLREIVSEEATLRNDSVIVEANDDNAIFTWPTDTAAESYTLQITKDGEVFCTLVFNENGQLTGIAFAPSRDGTATAPAATLSVAGMSFTVTGLNSASKYAYSLAVADDNSQELVSYHGEFATTGYQGEITPGGEPERPGGEVTSIEQQNHQSSIINHKLIKDGQLFIERNGKIYNAQGARVR